MGELLEKSRVGAAEPSMLLASELQAIYDLELQFVDPTLESSLDSAFKNIVLEAQDLAAEPELWERTAALLGKVATLDTTPDSEAEPVDQPMTLMEAVKKAAEGNQEALHLVRKNAISDYLERAYKSGHVINADFSVNEQGQLLQYGQTAEEMFINGFRHMDHPVLRSRSKIEAHNGQRQQYFYENGLLKDNAMVTFSLVPDVISRREAKKAKYFTETMSYAIQLVTEDEGKVIVQSAFVAGADSEDAPRFDKAAVADAVKEFDVDYQGVGTEEILARPLLIPKTLLPDLVLTLVQKVDSRTGRFFGRQHTGPKDYQAHMAECQRREKYAEALVEQFVVQQLLAEATTFTYPTDANERLDKLNDALLKRTIFEDDSIDSNVLGSQATFYVEEARFFAERGDFSRMQHAISEAQRLGSSSSCPTVYKQRIEFEDYLESMEFFEAEEETRDSKNEDCEFISKKCPECGEKNVHTTVKRVGNTKVIEGKGESCRCVKVVAA